RFSDLPFARVYAAVSRFSSTVKCSNTCRPSITSTIPRPTTSEGSFRWMGSPRNSTVPFVTSPRSVRSSPEMPLSVVLFPAPLAPRRATMPPSGLRNDTPFSTRITCSYITSTLLTASSVRALSVTRCPLSVLLGAVAHGVAELLAFLHSRRLDLRPHHVAHRLDPLRDDRPFLAVPLLNEERAVALVVVARHLDRVREALQAELIESLLRQVEVLEAPSHLLAGGRSVAELGHGRPDGLDREHRVDDATVVERRSDVFLLRRSLPLVVDVLDDVLVGLEPRARRVEGGALVALGSGAGGNHVRLTGRPPVADQVVHLEADGRRFLDRHLVHHTPSGQEDPVRIDPAHL